MNPTKVCRAQLVQLTDLPNVGPSLARDLHLLGYKTPHELAGADPVAIYEALCQRTGQRHDPCVLDIFLSITDFLAGNDPRPWWAYTKGRKSMQK
jgi:hypothetical protein